METNDSDRVEKISQMMRPQPPGDVNSLRWREKQQRVTRMREQYGDAASFLQTFTADLQPYAAREWERAYMGVAPVMDTVATGYGEATLLTWICMQLESVNLFAGVKEKLSVARQKELAGLIRVEYGHLKVSELLLFFHRLKCGRYGRFYGSVDALFITSALLQFMAERKADLQRITEWREQEQKTTAASSTGITYAEYLRRKAERENAAGGGEPQND